MTIEAGILLALLVAASLWAVMTYSLLLSAIGLGIVSAILAILMFELGAPMAAVLELSVCAGLITVVFISAISLTPRFSAQEKRADARKRLLRFIPLPFLVAAAAWFLWGAGEGLNLPALPASDGAEVRDVLWNQRTLDVVGQIVIILTGAFAVVVLFKNLKGSGEDRR